VLLVTLWESMIRDRQLVAASPQPRFKAFKHLARNAMHVLDVSELHAFCMERNGCPQQDLSSGPHVCISRRHRPSSWGALAAQEHQVPVLCQRKRKQAEQATRSIMFMLGEFAGYRGTKHSKALPPHRPHRTQRQR
jgi:hypothetical protein